MERKSRLLVFLLLILFTAIFTVTLATSQTRRATPRTMPRTEKGTAPVDTTGAMRMQRGMAGVDTTGMVMGHMMGMSPGMLNLGMMYLNNINLYLRHAQDLKLTDQQISQLRDRRAAFMKNTIDARAKIQTSMVDISQMMDQDPINVSQVTSRIRDSQDTVTNYLIQTVQAQADARNILTPDQRKIAMQYETSGFYAMMGIDDNMMRRNQRNTAPSDSVGGY
jgi:hypothetical protein